MTATLTCRVYTGTDAGTESASQTALTLTDADALTGGSVDPGGNSYERWIRLSVDDSDDSIVTNFTLQAAPNLPDGVVIKYGVTDTGVTPVATTSTVATHTLTAQRIIWDAGAYDADGDKTRYLVLQEVVASTATSGDIPQNTIVFGWSEA